MGKKINKARKMSELSLRDFAALFGTQAADISRECRDLISKTDWSYRHLAPEERDAAILDILRRIDSGEFNVAGRQKQIRWKEGWQDILNGFVRSGYNPEKLKPHYDLKPGQIIRFFQNYVMPKDPMFEMKWLAIFRIWIFRKYLSRVDNIYEFGCGTGQNLVVLAKLFPEKKLFGLEWVDAPVKILKLLAEKHGLNIEGRRFDMFSPDRQMTIAPNSAILTRASLEQIGPDHNKFLDFILSKKPALCINIEPITELYDKNKLPDYLAARFQEKRNYLTGYLNRLKELEKEGKIEIFKIWRVPFGSLHLDPYSYIVWRPKAKNSKTKK